MLCLQAIAIAVLVGPHDVDARSFAAHEVEPFVTQLRSLRQDLADANRERRAWGAYSEAWRDWSRQDANAATDGYTRSEYQWSVAGSRQMRSEVTEGRAFARLDRFASRHAGQIEQVVVTDARGGAVLMIGDAGDWFKGDERGFDEVTRHGRVWLGEILIDNDVRSQEVFVPILDDRGELLGVAIVTVKLDAASRYEH